MKLVEPKQITMGESPLCRAEVTVNLEHGLHLVPCSKIAELARRYDCEIRILKHEQVVDAKAVFDLMTLRADQGTSLVVEAEGYSADEAIEQLVELFENDFYVDRSR
ncbi:HPr family phosphocarrier protein [Rubinisphaera margarita]|uniref:HPr family phosphocarrier protein n=1 Tax=Rubinisphaera margarita TaxID=2909586 RepID=UPI0028F42D70|nr:HPr family phosphocarrier protein [Rubinisphaera margarita]